MRVYGEQHRNLWWCLWIRLIAGRKIQIVGFKMRVYGVKVENFVETFSFLERQPPNPVIRGHKKSAVRKRQEASEEDLQDLQDLDWGTCDESHYYKQEGEVRNRRRRGWGIGV